MADDKKIICTGEQPAPIFDPYNPKNRYKVLSRKPWMELSESELAELHELKAQKMAQDVAEAHLNQEETKKDLEHKKQHRQEWVSSGDNIDRFGKLIDECMTKFIFSNTVISRTTSLRNFRKLVEEYNLVDFFNKI